MAHVLISLSLYITCSRKTAVMEIVPKCNMHHIYLETVFCASSIQIIMKTMNLPSKLRHRSAASFLGVPKPHYACVSAVA